MMLSRRDFGLLGSACLGFASCSTTADATSTDGRLSARIATPAAPSNQTGVFRLEGWPRPIVYVPPELTGPAPLVLLLHGGGSDAERTLSHVLPAARERGVILLAPQAEGRTWDVVSSFGDASHNGAPPKFGQDAARLDASLKLLFSRFAVDPARVAIAGFSDGASYALSIGPRNGELVTHIMAFSPGGVAPFDDPPRAKIFISHGRRDATLPFSNTSDGIVPGFRGRWFDVEFVAFDGPHAFRDEEINSAFNWLLNG